MEMEVGAVGRSNRIIEYLGIVIRQCVKLERMNLTSCITPFPSTLSSLEKRESRNHIPNLLVTHSTDCTQNRNTHSGVCIEGHVPLHADVVEIARSIL